MGLIKAFSGALRSTLGDQWKDIITDSGFDNHTLISPGMRKTQDNERGNEFKGSSGVITKGSKIFVPENVACYIYSQSGIEQVVTEPGGYEYNEGQESVFSGGGLKSVFSQISERTKYGGISAEQKTATLCSGFTKSLKRKSDEFFRSSKAKGGYAAPLISFRSIARLMTSNLPII